MASSKDPVYLLEDENNQVQEKTGRDSGFADIESLRPDMALGDPTIPGMRDVYDFLSTLCV